MSQLCDVVVLRLAEDVLFEEEGALSCRTQEAHILEIGHGPIKVVPHVAVEVFLFFALLVKVALRVNRLEEVEELHNIDVLAVVADKFQQDCQVFSSCFNLLHSLVHLELVLEIIEVVFAFLYRWSGHRFLLFAAQAINVLVAVEYVEGHLSLYVCVELLATVGPSDLEYALLDHAKLTLSRLHVLAVERVDPFSDNILQSLWFELCGIESRLCDPFVSLVVVGRNRVLLRRPSDRFRGSSNLLLLLYCCVASEQFQGSV